MFATQLSLPGIGGLKLYYSQANSASFSWTDITPSEQEIDNLTKPYKNPQGKIDKCIGVHQLISYENRILAAIGVASTEEMGRMTMLDDALFISDDNGTTWTEDDIGNPEKLFINKMVQDPDNQDHIIYIGRTKRAYEDAVYHLPYLLRHSNDGGYNWSPVSNNTDIPGGMIQDVDIVGSTYYLTNLDQRIVKIAPPDYDKIELLGLPTVKKYGGFLLTDLVFDCNYSQIIYGIGPLGIIRSDDAYQTWSFASNGMITPPIAIVILHHTDPDVIATSDNRGYIPFITKDGGNTWEHMRGIVGYGDELGFDPHDPNAIYYMGERTQMFKAKELGGNFTNIANHFSANRVFDIEVSNENGGTVYASNLGTGISYFGEFNRFDEIAEPGQLFPRELHWKFMYMSPDYTYDIELDSEDSNILYASYSPKIFENISRVYKYNKTQYESIEPFQVEKTGWTTLLNASNSTGITSIEIDPNDPNKMYAGATGKRGKIYASNDKGGNWSNLNEHLIMCTVWGQPQLIVDPDDPSIAYAATWLGGTWKTKNAGTIWTLLEDAPISSTALSLNTQNTDIIYLADRSSPTVWKSSDAGSTWLKVADFRGDGALLVMNVFADGNNVYASTFAPMLQGGKLYKSTDAGANWNDITGTLPKGILDIEVDPKDPNRLYVTTNINGAYRSTNGGSTWNRMDNFPDVGAYDIEVDPDDSAILYTAARGGSLPSWFTEIAGDRPKGVYFNDSAGVYKSIDYGDTWSNLLNTSASCRAIRRHPDKSNLLFAPDLLDGFKMSTDGGSTWLDCNSGLNNAVPTSCAVGGNKIYVGTQGCGVYCGDIDPVNGLITWQPGRSNKPVPEVHNLKIIVDPSDSNHVYISSYPGGLFTTTDGGTTFRDRNAITPSTVVKDPKVQGYYTFAINPNNTTRTWVGTWGAGIFKSYNSNLLNVPAVGNNYEMFGKHINQIVVGSDIYNTVYAATQEGVYKSSDDGNTWVNMSSGLDTLDVLSLEINENGTIFAGTAGYGVYFYNATKGEWVHMGRNTGQGDWFVWARDIYQYSAFLFDPDVDGKIYLGHFPGGFFISEDHGNSWKCSSVGIGNDGLFSLTMHPTDHDIIFAGTYNGIIKSTDRGKTWELKDKGMPSEQWTFSVVIDDEDPNIMYAATKNGQNKGKRDNNMESFWGVLMKSEDGGESWYKIMNGLSDFNEYYSLVIYPPNHNTLFLSTRYGVFGSLDGGNNWVPINNGLPTLNNFVRDNVAQTLKLTCDGKYLILAISGYGVWRADISNLSAQGIEDLISDLEDLNLPKGYENSIVSKLENALKSLEKGNDEAAINQLNAFINAVEAQRSKKLTVEEADALITMALWVIDNLSGE